VRASRSGIAATLAAALAFASPAVAWADDPIEVIPTDRLGVVDTVVTQPGTPGGTQPAGAGSGEGGSGGGPQCTYTPDGTNPASHPEEYDWSKDPSQGSYLIKTCYDGTVDFVWVPKGTDPSAAPVVTPAQLAQQAYNRLRLPLPQANFNPKRSSSAGAATLVTIPTWFWVEDWSGASQRTQAGGVWARVSAEPVGTDWYPGDGSAVSCSGGGVEWRQGMDESDSSCKHAYRRSSANEPDNRYTGRVVVTWRVTWRGSGGSGGALPLMTREASFPIAVMERQTVVVSGRGSGA